MLFGLSNASGNSGGRPHELELFDQIRYDRGLGALVPHFSNYRTTSGGGGTIHVAGTGGGGGSGSGDSTGTALAPTTPPGPGASYGVRAASVADTRPVDRNSPIFDKSSRRSLFQPTGQGPRLVVGRRQADVAATIDPGASIFPTGRLFGLGGLESFWGDVGTRLRRVVTPPRTPANIARLVLAPFTLGASYLIPSRVFRTPFIEQPINALKTVVRYSGAAYQTVLFPILTGAQQRQIFGLSPIESRVFMKGQQVFRAIDAAVLTYGLSKYIMAARQAAAMKEAAAIAGPQNNLSLLGPTAPQPFAAPLSLPPGYATPAQFASAAPASLPVGPVPPSLALNLPQTAPFTPAGAPLSLPPGYATAAQIAGTSAPAAAPGSSILGTIGHGALDAAKFAGTTAVTTAAQIALANALAPKGGGGAGGGGVSPLVLPSGPMDQGIVPAGYQSGGGGSYDPGVPADSGAQLAGMGLGTQLVIGGIAATAVIAFIAKRGKSRRKN